MIDKATHRSFDSTYCDQMQASGAVFDENADGVVDEAELANTRVILDRHTIAGILSHPTSGKAVEYCSLTTFTSPIDIRPLVASLTGFIVTDTNVPTTRLNTDAFKQEMTKRAVDFFDDVLKRGQ